MKQNDDRYDVHIEDKVNGSTQDIPLGTTLDDALDYCDGIDELFPGVKATPKKREEHVR